MEMPSDPQGSSAESRPKFLQQTLPSPRTQTAPLGTSVERWGRGKRGSARALRPQTDRQTDPPADTGWASSTRTEPQVWGAGPRERQSEFNTVTAPSQEGPMPSRSALPREMCWVACLHCCARGTLAVHPGQPAAPSGGRKEPGSPRSAGRPLRARPQQVAREVGGLQGPCRNLPGALAPEANRACLLCLLRGVVFFFLPI